MADPFHWLDGATVVLSATSTSSKADLQKMPTGATQIRLANKGPNTVFIRKGTGDSATSPAVAVTSDFPVLAGTVEVLTLRNSDRSPITHIAGICASTETATLYITTGAGE